LKKMLLLERDPLAGRPLLGNLVGWRNLVVGDPHWRVVWRVTTDGTGHSIIDIAEIWAVGARVDADIYREMGERVALMGDDPEALALTELIARLGRAADSVVAVAEPVADPVPAWLVDRLVHQAGMAELDLAGLTGAAAMTMWEEFLRKS
jgi:mRNA interferase RelE/StbE